MIIINSQENFAKYSLPQGRSKARKKIHHLRDSKLRRIRYGFRSLLYLLYRESIDKSFAKYSDIQTDEALSYKQRKKILREILEQREDLVSAMRRSPLICGWCSDLTEDLVLNPKRQSWFCVNCYGVAHQLYPREYP